jgi:hypothetical protein
MDKFSDKIRMKYEVNWKMSLERKKYFYANIFLYDFIDLATNGAIQSTLKEYETVLKKEIKHSLSKNWAQLFWST